jgi:hypothetical protein
VKGITLFLGAFFVFNLNCRPIPSGDTIGAALLPLRIVLEETVTLDPYADALARVYDGNAYFLHWKDGHAYSAYPVAQSLLLSPLYLPAAWLPGVRRWRPEPIFLLARALEKVMASLIAAASAAFLFLLLRRLMSSRRALLLAAVYAFATNTWATSSQALWQHGPSQLAMVLSLLCLQAFLDGRGKPWTAAGAGLFAALSPALRPTDVLFFAVSAAVLGVLARRAGLLRWYALFGVLCGGAVAAYNLWLFGNLRGGYGQPLAAPFWTGVAGLVLSPSHGLLVFSPVLAFAVVGAWRWLRERPARGREVYLIALLFPLAHLLACARWWSWWGGACYGPRMMADTLPCLVLLLGPALDAIGRRRPARTAFAAALVFSVAVQVVGVFFYPSGAGRDEALWDWRRCPIVENARAGPARAHYAALALWGRQLLSGQRPDWTGTPLHLR